MIWYSLTEHAVRREGRVAVVEIYGGWTKFCDDMTLGRCGYCFALSLTSLDTVLVVFHRALAHVFLLKRALKLEHSVPVWSYAVLDLTPSLVRFLEIGSIISTSTWTTARACLVPQVVLLSTTSRLVRHSNSRVDGTRICGGRLRGVLTFAHPTVTFSSQSLG